MPDFRHGVDVVVVNYKTYDDLIKFIRSYEYQLSDDIDSELIIIDVEVDGDQYDHAKEILAQFKHLKFQYWPIDTNCGYSGACNFASTTTDGEVIAFFNADTQLHEDTLKVCYEELMSHDDWAVVGPMQVNSQGKITHAGIFGTNEKPLLRAWQSRKLDEVRDVREAISVSGSAYFVKRKAWDDARHDPRWVAMYPNVDGALLPTPHYYEETWFSYFIRELGWKVIYMGTVDMIHEWHQASRVGEIERLHMETSRSMFRNACDFVGIPRD